MSSRRENVSSCGQRGVRSRCETKYEWKATDGAATRMRLRNRGKPSGFSRLVAPFMTIAVRRANRKDLAKLKAILEWLAP